jgi:hypothetical protein
MSSCSRMSYGLFGSRDVLWFVRSELRDVPVVLCSRAMEGPRMFECLWLGNPQVSHRLVFFSFSVVSSWCGVVSFRVLSGLWYGVCLAGVGRGVW